jgi:NADPH-dependent ferric siderophore reductase
VSFTYASVVQNAALTRRLRRITLQIDEPEALDVKDEGDSAVGVYFPLEGPNGLRAPSCVTGPDGTRVVDSSSGAQGRNYSVRRQDGDRIDLDLVLHAHGPGARWARTARPGDRVGLDHARSWYSPDPASTWQLLVTDLSGLPAAARIIEHHPVGTPATAIVEVLDADDLRYLPAHPDVDVVASVGTGNGYAPSRLARHVRDHRMPNGHGYCWFAGEAAESRAVRKYLRSRGWAHRQYDITGYWRFDSEAWDERFAVVQEEVLAVYARALSAGKGDKVASEEFDEALERAGL